MRNHPFPTPVTLPDTRPTLQSDRRLFFDRARVVTTQDL